MLWNTVYLEQIPKEPGTPRCCRLRRLFAAGIAEPAAKSHKARAGCHISMGPFAVVTEAWSSHINGAPSTTVECRQSEHSLCNDLMPLTTVLCFFMRRLFLPLLIGIVEGTCSGQEVQVTSSTCVRSNIRITSVRGENPRFPSIQPGNALLRIDQEVAPYDIVPIVNARVIAARVISTTVSQGNTVLFNERGQGGRCLFFYLLTTPPRLVSEVEAATRISVFLSTLIRLLLPIPTIRCWADGILLVPARTISL